MLKILKSIIFNLSTKNINFFTKRFFYPRLIFFAQGSFFLHRGSLFLHRAHFFCTRCHFFCAPLYEVFLFHCYKYNIINNPYNFVLNTVDVASSLKGLYFIIFLIIFWTKNTIILVLILIYYSACQKCGNDI